jgi:hypothetical protein
MQKDAAHFSRRLGHQNPRVREASRGQWQGADMILMRMRHQNRFDLTVGDCFEIGQRILPGILRMHPAIDQKPVWANLEIVRIRADFRAPCKIYEFQMQLR